MDMLVRYDITDAAISKMREEFLPLKINGIDDKEGLSVVHDARMVMKSHRVAVEKRRKDLKAEALAYGRAVDTEAKRIFGLIEPIEKHLQEQEDFVAREKERIKREKEEAEKKRIQARIDELSKYGVVMPFWEVASMTDIDYGTHLRAAELMWEEEQERIRFEAEEKAKKDAEEKRVREEMEARIKAQEEELRVKAEELRKKEEELKKAEEEKKAIEAEKKTIEAEKKVVEAEKNVVEAEKKIVEEKVIEKKRPFVKGFGETDEEKVSSIITKLSDVLFACNDIDLETFEYQTILDQIAQGVSSVMLIAGKEMTKLNKPAMNDEPWANDEIQF